MFIWPTCLREISKNLQNSKNQLSADHIPTTILKSPLDNILLALIYTFNLSTSKNKFIDCFKLANICPLFKKGN